MNKKLNKKGFTIVELVIVIAVIAILAGVLIPTFSGMINKSKESAALQEVTNAYKVYATDVMSKGQTPEAYIKVVHDSITIVIENGAVEVFDSTKHTQTYTNMEIGKIGEDKALVAKS